MDLKTDFKEAYKQSKMFNDYFLSNISSLRIYTDEVPKKFERLLEFRTFREIYLALISLAIKRQTVNYGTLASIVNSRLNEDVLPTQGSWLGLSLGEILGSISIYEFSRGNPLLSVIVYNSTTKKPGDGFYELVEKLGLKIKENCEKYRVFITWGGYQRK